MCRRRPTLEVRRLLWALGTPDKRTWPVLRRKTHLLENPMPMWRRKRWPRFSHARPIWYAKVSRLRVSFFSMLISRHQQSKECSITIAIRLPNLHLVATRLLLKHQMKRNGDAVVFSGLPPLHHQALTQMLCPIFTLACQWSYLELFWDDILPAKSSISTRTVSF